jgi:3-hydroxyisobutyrate dehydrogenase-like beta-hydroxyacid dehydrogenase
MPTLVMKFGGTSVADPERIRRAARRVAEAAAAKGVLALDAPVSGGDVGARNGTLSVMCGGTPEAFGQLIVTDIAKFAKVVKAANMQVE